MKKYIAFLLCFIMTLSLFSCDLNENQNAESAMEMYEAAIKGEICVFDERIGETKLESLRFTSNGLSLDEYKLLKKAVADIDGDGVSEYVIQSPNKEYIILRYYNGKVYSYRLDTGNYYIFNTDGTFYWYDPSAGGGKECGLNKIIFDGETLNTKPIYSLKYSANPTKYEYFVEEEAVTEDEYYAYRTDNIRYEKMKFSYFEITCSYPITAEQAWNLANEYWDNQDGRMDGAAGSVYTARIVLTDTPSADSEYYRVAFQVERAPNVMEWQGIMPPREVELKDQILVNAFTGEITSSTYDPDGKDISVEQAIEIAKKHYEIHNEENGYRVEHDGNAIAPDHVYVIVIQEYVVDHYSVFAKIWVDKNTGETIVPYFINGK